MPLTLVPESLAAPGKGFLFAGPNRGGECDGCPFQRLCFGLTPGRGYKVAAVREVSHPCALHDGGRARVVEVAESAFDTSLESRLLRGTAATWSPIACRRPECPSYALCHPHGRPAGRHEIVQESGAMECPAGYEIHRVRLRPI